jgi:hypothetical protein
MLLDAVEDASLPNRRPRARLWVGGTLGIFGLMVAGLKLWAHIAKPPVKPIVVVYDQVWSRAAALRNYPCAPEIRAECQRTSLDAESGFQHAMEQALQEIPECHDVHFIADSGEGLTRADANLIARVKSRRIWRLRIDSHVSVKPWELARSERGSDYDFDARNMMTYMCGVARRNGPPPIYW